MNLTPLAIRPMAFQRTRISVLVGALFVIGCDSPVAPPKDAGEVLMTIQLYSPATHVEEEWAFLSCEVVFTAAAEGQGFARLAGATARWYYGFDAAAADSQVFHSSEIIQAFDADTLRPGDSFEAVFVASGAAPFDLEMTFRWFWSDEPQIQSTTVRGHCGKVIPPGSGPPTVSILSVTPTATPLEVGDSVYVTYSASGPAGLWQTGVELFGSFAGARTFHESTNLVSEHTVGFRVPDDVALGLPVQVGVYAYDIALRLGVTDSTPPIVAYDLVPPTLTGFLSGGDLFTDDTLTLTGTATDNFRPTWLVWRLELPVPEVDSIALPGVGVAKDFRVRFPVRPHWVGRNVPVTIWARDGAGLSSGPVTAVTGNAEFFETVDPGIVPTGFFLGPGLAVHDVVLDPLRQRLYATQVYHTKVTSFDVATMTAGPFVTLPTYAGALSLTSSGDSILVTQALVSSLAVVRLDDFTALPPIPIAALDTMGPISELLPTGVDVAGGTALVQTMRSANGTRSVSVDLSTGLSRIRHDAIASSSEVIHWWHRMAATPDGSRIVIFEEGCARYYVVASDSFTPCAPWASGYRDAVTLSAAGDLVLVAGRLYQQDLQQIIDLGRANAIVAPDGQSVLYVVNRRLIRARASDGEILRGMRLPLGPDLLIVSPDGMTLYAINRDAGLVAKVALGGL